VREPSRNVQAGEENSLAGKTDHQSLQRQFR
jgi:hypothetical protein